MLLLTSTSDLLQMITGSAVSTINVHASYVDYNSGVVTPGRTNTSQTAAATVTIVGSPGSSIQRNAKYISIFNSHATSSNLITIQHTDGTTVSVLVKYTLLPGETLLYSDTVGFQVLAANGGVKSSLLTSPNAGLITVAFAAGAPNLDASLGASFKLTLTGAATLTSNNATSGQSISVLIVQDATGGRVLTWPASFKGTIGISAGSAVAANAVVSQDFVYDGTNWYATGPGTIN